MRRTERAQGLRMIKFEEVYGRTQARLLSPAEAAEVLGMSERTFRRWRDRYEAEGAEGLYDRRLGRVSARRAPARHSLARRCCRESGSGRQSSCRQRTGPPAAGWRRAARRTAGSARRAAPRSAPPGRSAHPLPTPLRNGCASPSPQCRGFLETGRGFAPLDGSWPGPSAGCSRCAPVSAKVRHPSPKAVKDAPARRKRQDIFEIMSNLFYRKT